MRTAGTVDKVKGMLLRRVTGQAWRAAGFMCDKERKLNDQKIQGFFFLELVKLLVLVIRFFLYFCSQVYQQES